jgi:septation ring formation regulator EzrA
MTRPNGTTKWVAILVSAIVATVGFTYAVATDSVEAVNDSVTVVAARQESLCGRVNELERDSTETRTDIKYLVRMIEDLTRKVDKALEN